MASTYTNNGIELITSGEQSGTWGTTSNTNWTSMEAMVTGYVDYTVTNASTRTETIADGAADDFLNLTGATDAGWGIGTTLTFIYNGSKWHVECFGTAQGNGSTAATAAFATT